MQLKRNKEMEFETLKKRHKKQIVIGALAVCVIGGALTFATTRAKYKLTQDIPLARGTINYTPYDFKIMAMYQSEDGTNYTEIEEMPESGYTINEEKSYCEMDDGTQVKGKFKTIDKQHTITNITKHDKCYIWFDKEKATAEDTLAKLNITNVNTNTPDFSKTATTDEGIFKAEDGMYGGTSYYWRGKVENNYVIFAGYCWRIVRINGDGSIRLIYDGSTCHANGSNLDSIAKTSIAYNSNYNNSSYVGWTYTASSQRPTPSTGGTASNAKTQLESWYSTTITGTNADKVADGIYCNDRTVGSGTWSATGSTFYYGGYTRLQTSKAPSLGCDASDRYTLKVGLITADEVSMAGGVYGKSNSSYYLCNDQSYWTMSPRYWDGTYARVFLVSGYGYLGDTYDGNVGGVLGLRPVINLRANVTFSSGDGSLNNPYVVK